VEATIDILTAAQDNPAEEQRALVHRTASFAAALRNADMQEKADLYKGLNLRLTYEHVTGIMRAEAQLGECPFWDKVRVRGGT
jgi:iron uptake system EfeUOB component EfeO/EfeM